MKTQTRGYIIYFVAIGVLIALCLTAYNIRHFLHQQRCNADEFFSIVRQEPEPQEAATITVKVNGKTQDLKRPNVTCEVGELIEIDLRESTIGGVAWRILPGTKDFKVIEPGRRAFFSSRGPGKYLIVIGGAKDDHAYLEHFHITVKGDDTTPAGPSLSSNVADWFARVEDYEKRNAHADAVAKVFTKIVDQDGVDVDDILEATALANSAVLGDDLDKWKPFLDELGLLLDEYTADGKLRTRSDYRRVWQEIARGIERGL